MKFIVIGGSGLIGSRLVALLAGNGHDVVAASRRSGVDIVSGKGLDEVLIGASVVIDVSKSPSFEDTAAMAFVTASTRNLLTRAAAAGVTHHVALTVVGTAGRLGSGYLHAKLAQEASIEASGFPYSIVRSTQFFEFLEGIADAATDGTVVRVPPVLAQPIAGDDVARTLARIATGTPLNGGIEIAGPELFELADAVQRVLVARRDPRGVIVDPHARYFGAVLGERSLLPGGNAELGGTRFDDWLARTARPAADRIRQA